MSHAIPDLTPADFTAAIADASPLVVDFWAPWCGPCRQMAPTLESLARDYDGRVRFAKLNVDEAAEIAGRFGVRAIPTLLVFRGGEVVASTVGSAPRAQIEAALERALQ